eukprot:TRINITY_DN19575_c0_g1_i1.p1 TRINITY_DN19575_c0_g1~~TRINITY_DN19575_c0_g1_i1.p1  ORF type:complete len:292 (+),score=112.75 TRINITY_DN19575_c0_g1_i1:91-876(+)
MSHSPPAHARVTALLQSTSGRDVVMSLCQYFPAVMAPVIKSIAGQEAEDQVMAFCGLCGQYRGVTRLHLLWNLLQGKVAELQRLAKGHRIGDPIPYLLGQIKWLMDIGFAYSEAVIIFTNNGIINKGMDAKRKAQLGPRCIWFFFWGLLIGQAKVVVELLRLQKSGEPEEEGKKQLSHADLLKQWAGMFFWWLVAFGSMPRDGSAVQLLADPASSIFRPLHTLVEKTTVPGLPAGPWTMQLFGLVATITALVPAWDGTKGK